MLVTSFDWWYPTLMLRDIRSVANIDLNRKMLLIAEPFLNVMNRSPTSFTNIDEAVFAVSIMLSPTF